MSSKKKSTGGKSTSEKTGKLLFPPPEPFVAVTPAFSGTDPKTLPFLEWSDQDLNSEQWDLPKSKVSLLFALLCSNTFLII